MIYNDANFKILHQGIDTLVIGVNCTDERVFDSSFAKFKNHIASAKQEAQFLNTYGDKYTKHNLGLAYGDFMVSSKGQGSYFGFVSNDDIFFVVSDGKFCSKKMYDLKIQFRAVYLLKYGHIYCYEQVCKFLDDIFCGRNYSVTFLRLDLATDVTGIKYTPQDFLNFRSLKKVSNYTQVIKKDDDELLDFDDNTENYVTLSELNINNFMRFSRFEGVSFGKNPHMFRVYDKIKQIQNKNISGLIFSKWDMNGFDIHQDLHVFRHEVEFGRAFIKKLLPIGIKDEAIYIFTHLPAFWSQGLTIAKWYDLTDEEQDKISSNLLKPDSVKSIYFRCDKDETRLQLWDKLRIWDDFNTAPLIKHGSIQQRDIKQAKKALKMFISAVYKNMGTNPDNFKIVLDEVKQDLEREGLSIYDYGMSKLSGSFNQNEKIINLYDLDIDNPLAPMIYFALDEFVEALSTSRSKDFSRTIEQTLSYIKQDVKDWK